MLSPESIEALKKAKPFAESGTKEWAHGNLPSFKGMKAFILPGAGYSETVALFAEAGFQRSYTVESADVVVFLGGEDVTPSLYGQKKCPKTRSNSERDTIEEFYFHKAVKLKVPMFGICRGAQFLHVMNGGKLWQDVNNHAGPDHKVVDLEEDISFMSTSLHHQMIQWQSSMELIAVTEEQIATTFEDADLLIDLGGKGSDAINPEMEVEAGAYVDTRCFFTQGHPEIGSPEYRSWTMHKLHDFLMDWLPFMSDPDMEKVIKDVVSKQIG